MDRSRREAMVGLSGNELMFGIVEEADQKTYGEILLNQRPRYVGRRYVVDEVLEDVM